jgi:hypothetical protein
MIGAAIFDKLSNDTGVTALVGDRIYPNVSPDNIYPLIVYTVEQEPEESIDAMELKEFSVTLTIVARSYAALQLLAPATKTALDGQRGTWGGILVRSCNLQSPTSEDSYTDSGNSEITYHTGDQMYRVWAKP